MRQIIGLMAIAALLLGLETSVQAETQTANVSATVEGGTTFGMTILELDENGLPIGNDLAPNMNFGTLNNLDANGTPTNNALHGEKAYAVFLSPAVTTGQSYTIQTSMDPLSNGGGNSLPNAVFRRVIQALDFTDADIPGDSFPSDAQSAYGQNELIYTSNATGQGGNIQLVYAVHGGPSPFADWEPITPAQAAGTYTGAVTFTLTQN